MENIKFIDITQLPEDLWQDAKNLIAIDSNGEVIKAAKQDSYSKNEIDDLLRDAEISADKLQSKIQINSASTDYVVTQPTVSGDSLVITDSMSDKNQYHTFGYDKEKTSRLYGLLPYGFIFNKNDNSSMCENWNASKNTLTFDFYPSIDNREPITLNIPLGYVEGGSNYVTEIVIDCSRDNMTITSNGNQYKGNKLISFFGDSQLFKIYLNDSLVDLNGLNIQNIVSIYLGSGKKTVKIVLETLQQDDITMFKSIMKVDDVLPTYLKLGTNYQLYGYYDELVNTSEHPERLNDYIRYSNNVKAYILTDKNTTFKTINGQQITGNGNIEISTDVDLSNLATKEELATKQDVINDLETIRSGAALGATALQSVPSEYATEQWVNSQGFLKEHQDISNLATKAELATKQDKLVNGTNIKSINGTSLLSSGNMELATKEELNTKQDVITDLDSIRSGAALGATALQTVPSGYATEQWVNEQGFLKEHQDISNLATKEELNTKQDIINDLETIRSGSALGATALQSVPDTYALKSEIPDITTKQDTLVSGSNIKTINGTSLLGAGNIEVAKEWIGTQAEYDALPTKDNNTTYYITE